MEGNQTTMEQQKAALAELDLTLRLTAIEKLLFEKGIITQEEYKTKLDELTMGVLEFFIKQANITEEQSSAILNGLKEIK